MRGLTIAAYPADGPYPDCFYAALRRRGVTAVAGGCSFRWLIANAKRVDWFHFHWPHLMYCRRVGPARTVIGLLRFALFLAAILAAGKRVVWTAHNLFPHNRGGRVHAIAHLVARHMVVRAASVILVHGPTARAVLERRFPGAARKTVTIDHGHFADYYGPGPPRERARAKLNVPREAFVYLSFGLCRRYKNLETLITTFGRIEGEPLLLICGEFDDRSYCREIQRLVRERGERVRLVARRVSDGELAAYLKASDAVVLPYRETLTSGAGMLAISFGVPVVAPRMGYLTDTIAEHCGCLYDGADPEALLRAMKRVRKRAFDEAAIVQHALTYDWDRIARKAHAAILSA